ncbi:MAG: UbiD family decarboxylase [Deltaproteobacteria bacterium]|nr:UbiD family decarboxylase [Deltaproteobacteria bacterium]
MAIAAKSEQVWNYRGLREWIDAVDRLGQLRKVTGAHWDLEIGAVTELLCEKYKQPPSILFDGIPDYPKNYRVLSAEIETVERLALTTGLPPRISPLEFVQRWRHKVRQIKPIEPEVVKDGPLLQNVLTGDDISILKFPAPRWHEEDGGRYIGTADLVITRDPEEGWVNLGTYRSMVHDERSVGLYISPGKHGRIQRQKYYDNQKSCPVAISFGQDPLLFIAASIDVPYGMNELAYAGGVRGEPIQVISGPKTGLPIPANSEIAIEGEMIPGDLKEEGPFGEWTGYYASHRRPEPVVRIHTLMYRSDPILCGAPPLKPSVGQGFYRSLLRSALIWNALEETGVPDVTGVAVHPAASRLMVIVGIKQRYPGHAKQAAVIAGQCRAGGYMGRYVVVVDDDVNIFDSDDVIWAICTRSDPQQSIDIVRRCWSGPLDPMLPAGAAGLNSRAIIDATRPYERKDFPRVTGMSPELKKKMAQKWEKLLI